MLGKSKFSLGAWTTGAALVAALAFGCSGSDNSDDGDSGGSDDGPDAASASAGSGSCQKSTCSVEFQSPFSSSGNLSHSSCIGAQFQGQPANAKCTQNGQHFTCDQCE